MLKGGHCQAPEHGLRAIQFHQSNSEVEALVEVGVGTSKLTSSLRSGQLKIYGGDQTIFSHRVLNSNLGNSTTCCNLDIYNNALAGTERTHRVIL